MFITLLGVLTGVAIAMTVDSSALLRLPLLLHGLCGLGAGLIMEIGTRTPVPVWILRLLLCLLLSVTAVSFWKTLLTEALPPAAAVSMEMEAYRQRI